MFIFVLCWGIVQSLQAKELKAPIIADAENRIYYKQDKDVYLFLEGSHFALKNDQLVELPRIITLKNGKLLGFSNLPEEKNLSVEISSNYCSSQRPVKRIFLDPGHGGSDLGASIGKLHEKDIVLKVSKLLKKQLELNGFSVSESRTKDVFLPLDIRPELAKKWQADVFVSIHINSSPSKEAHGTETYILSQDASDAEARRLANKENAILKLPKGNNPIRDILWDMEQTVFLQESAYLASFIQQELVASASKLVKENIWKNRGVRQAPFFVLSRASMPAVLVELAYLSNKQDRALLLNQNIQDRLAKAIASGIKTYGKNCEKK